MPPRFLYPLLPYRSMLFPFFVVSAIAVPVWLIVRLYFIRSRRYPLSWPREILLLTFVVYLSGLAAATLTPNHPSRQNAETAKGVELRPNLASLTCSSATLPSGWRAQAFCAHNARGNFMLFVPLGILIPLLWRRAGFWKGMQIAIALSVGIEIVQYFSRAWGSYRSADINDVILNGAGACLGLLVVSLLRWRPADRRIGRLPAVEQADG
jgi:glycopeptide antibiotics resistance protein